MSINRMMVDKGIPAIKARAMLRKDTKKGYIVPPKAAPEARRVTSQVKKPEPPREGSSKPTGSKRKSAPTPLVTVNINSSSSSEDDEENIVPPNKAPPAGRSIK